MSVVTEIAGLQMQPQVTICYCMVQYIAVRWGFTDFAPDQYSPDFCDYSDIAYMLQF